jgi:hypothetical protein
MENKEPGLGIVRGVQWGDRLTIAVACQNRKTVETTPYQFFGLAARLSGLRADRAAFG